ncbi:189_t:CDS:10, partial [Rhizophagus irregularis]
MLSVNNQRRPSVGTNVTSSMGVRRPSDGNVQPIINNMNDSTSNNGQKKNPTSPILTGKPSNGHFPITEPRSRSSSVSSMHSSGSYLLQDMPGVYSQLGLLPTSSLQRQNIFPAEIDTDLITNEATSSGRHHSPPSPVSANADGSNVSSPTSAAASLTRRDHITGHTHDRSRSASFDGEIEPSAWTLDRVLEWLDDNSFSEYKTMFIENNLCGEQFFALGKFKTIKNIVESGDSNRYRLINAIRKIGDVRPKRQSFSNKGNQPDVQSPHSGGQLSLSNSINEQNSPTTPTIQSVPSPTEQISKQKSLKLSTSFPDLRSVKGPITSPVIGPRHSSIGWQTKSNNSSNSTIISSIKETDSSNENTAALPMNNNDKWAKSSVHNNPSVIQKQTSEDITSPLSPNSNRKTKGGPNSSLKIHGETTKNIQVTFDNKTFRVIDLGGREDPSTIKETIFSQLEIPQIEREHCSFHLTEIGQKEIGPTIDDETLIQKCKKADVRGSLKLLIMRKQLSDPYYGQIHNQGKIISGGDQSNKSKILRRTTPPEMSPPHVSPESNHSLPFNNNNDERKYYNITGGSNPIILERWKAEGLSHLTEESQDFSKFREPKDVAYQISHAYSSDHKTHYRTPPNSNHRRHDRENLNYSNSSSPQHRVGDVDYSLNNAPLKSRSQLPPSSKHPVVLQPANGMMNTRRPPSRESIIRNPDNNNRSPPPPPIPPKPNIVTQKSLMSIHGMYMNHNSISQPHLPLPQNLSTNNQESEHYQRPIHAMVSEPDLPLREPQLFSQPGKEFNRHIVQGSTKALFPDDDDEPPLWPKITLSSQSKKEEESFWAEEPKPSTQNAISSFNDEDSLWAETAESFKDKNTSNEGSSWKESSKPSQTDNLSHINDELPPRTSSLINSIDPLRKSLDKTSIEDDENVPIPPKSLSYTSEDSEGDEDFWAQEPISKRDVESMKSNDVINETGNSNSISPSEGIQSNNKSASPTQKPKNGLARTVSLRRGVTESWVVRPTAEDLFEQLEQYFPGHDLDKPIVDSVQQPNINEESPSAPTVKTGGKIQRGKSIRAAAPVGVVSAIEAFSDAIRVPQKLTRKPTTKLWDKKIVLVPSHKKPCPPEVPPGECVSTEREPVISWAKGELIGKGTFGKVFLAMNVNSSEIMAVKQIELPKTKSDRLNERQQNLVKSFTDEMEILKDLDHEHIVQYIGFEKTDEAINIFLEYVNGGSIGTCLRIYGAFKEPVVRSFTRQILLGLQYLHNRGILHRDIKADNILVDEEGYCKISDFGISKKSEHLAYDHSSNMSLQGTIFWMAPEVFNSTKGYSAKVDIWSLGCVVLEMFAGERPWNNLTDLAAMFKLGSEKKAPPIREDIIMSSDARNFLDQCFIIEPNNRPTAEQLLQHPFAQENPNFHFKEYISIPG